MSIARAGLLCVMSWIFGLGMGASLAVIYAVWNEPKIPITNHPSPEAIHAKMSRIEKQ